MENATQKIPLQLMLDVHYTYKGNVNMIYLHEGLHGRAQAYTFQHLEDLTRKLDTEDAIFSVLLERNVMALSFGPEEAVLPWSFYSPADKYRYRRTRDEVHVCNDKDIFITRILQYSFVSLVR